VWGRECRRLNSSESGLVRGDLILEAVGAMGGAVPTCVVKRSFWQWSGGKPRVLVDPRWGQPGNLAGLGIHAESGLGMGRLDAGEARAGISR
jgi:hypothetical protein